MSLAGTAQSQNMRVKEASRTLLVRAQTAVRYRPIRWPSAICDWLQQRGVCAGSGSVRRVGHLVNMLLQRANLRNDDRAAIVSIWSAFAHGRDEGVSGHVIAPRKNRHSSSSIMCALRHWSFGEASPDPSIMPLGGGQRSPRLELGKLATVSPSRCTASNSSPLLPWTVINRTASRCSAAAGTCRRSRSSASNTSCRTRSRCALDRKPQPLLGSALAQS